MSEPNPRDAEIVESSPRSMAQELIELQRSTVNALNENNRLMRELLAAWQPTS